MTWYDRINGGASQVPAQNTQAPGYSGMRFMSPVQRMNAIQQAMRNPAAFAMQALPSLPADIANDPNRILDYMKQNLGVTDADIQNAISQIPRGW